VEEEDRARLACALLEVSVRVGKEEEEEERGGEEVDGRLREEEALSSE